MLNGVPLEQAMCLILVPQWALQASLQRRAQQQDLHCTAVSSPAPAQSTMVLLMPALLSDVTPCSAAGVMPRTPCNPHEHLVKGQRASQLS